MSVDPRAGMSPRVDGDEAALRATPSRFDRLITRVAGPAYAEPFPPHVGERELAIEALHELRTAVALLRELRDVESGELVSVRRRWIIDAARPFSQFRGDAGAMFHALKLDNPSAVDVDVRYDGSQPLASNSDDRVPARTGRVIVAEFDVVSVGIDPAVMPAGATVLYVTLYSRPIAPTTYAFAP